jgi:hypothetical protein
VSDPARGRPPKYGVSRTSTERNAERRAVMMAVVDAAEGWARAYGVRGEEWELAQVRLSEAVQAWRAYRGQV